MVLPAAIEGVILLAQNEDNDKAREAFARVVENFQRQGKRVRVARPLAFVKDINDVARLA
jgi:hypothetical protein